VRQASRLNTFAFLRVTVKEVAVFYKVSNIFMTLSKLCQLPFFAPRSGDARRVMQSHVIFWNSCPTLMLHVYADYTIARNPRSS